MDFKVTYLDKGSKKIQVEKNTTQNEIINKYNTLNAEVISIEKLSNIHKIITHKKFNDRDLYTIFSNLEILISSGMDIRKSLSIVASIDNKYKDTLLSIERSVLSGVELAESFENSKMFPPLTTGVVSAGIESSSLDRSFGLLAKYFHNEYKLKEGIKNALYYPLMLIIVSIVVIGIVMSYVFPQYISLFDSYGMEELPTITRLLISMSNTIKSYSLYLLLIIALLVLAIYKLLQNDSVKLKINRIMLRFPIIGKYLLNLDLQRYSGVLSLMLISGIDIIKSLEISATTVKNYYLSNQMYQIKDKVLKGNTMYQSFKDLDIRNNIFVSLIHIGEESNSLGETMDKSYQYLEQYNKQYTKKVIALFEPMIILIIGLIIGFIVIGIAMPTFNIVDIF